MARLRRGNWESLSLRTVLAEGCLIVTQIGALIVLDPDEARRRILAAIDVAQGHRGKAAAALGGTQRNLYRWIATLRAWPAIDALCERQGYFVQPGPPRSPR